MRMRREIQDAYHRPYKINRSARHADRKVISHLAAQSGLRDEHRLVLRLEQSPSPVWPRERAFVWVRTSSHLCTVFPSTRPVLIYWAVGVDQYLHVSILSLVKLLIRFRRIIYCDLMADHEARLGFARDDHVSKVAVVCFDVALTGSKMQTL